MAQSLKMSLHPELLGAEELRVRLQAFVERGQWLGMNTQVFRTIGAPAKEGRGARKMAW